MKFNDPTNPTYLRNLAWNQRYIGRNRDFVAEALEGAADEIERLRKCVPIEEEKCLTNM